MTGSLIVIFSFFLSYQGKTEMCSVDCSKLLYHVRCIIDGKNKQVNRKLTLCGFVFVLNCSVNCKVAKCLLHFTGYISS